MFSANCPQWIKDAVMKRPAYAVYFTDANGNWIRDEFTYSAEYEACDRADFIFFAKGFKGKVKIKAVN